MTSLTMKANEGGDLPRVIVAVAREGKSYLNKISIFNEIKEVNNYENIKKKGVEINMSQQFMNAPAPSQEEFEDLAEQIGTQNVATGIEGVTAYKAGNIVTLYVTKSVQLTAGSYYTIGSLPEGLRPATTMAIGNATAGYPTNTLGQLVAYHTGNLDYTSPIAQTLNYGCVTFVAG